MSVGEITQLLTGWDNNRAETCEKLIPAVYAELRRTAAALMRNERAEHTLQPTALINEVYLRMVQQDVTGWKDRAHFFGIAARLMRQVLVEHARRRSRLKRNGGVKAVFQEEIAVHPASLELVLDLDDALTRMAEWDPRKLEIVELHYFGGLKAEEICEALDLKLPTVRRDLLLGRAWLREQFGVTGHGGAEQPVASSL